jgi:hypothetical protein
VKYDEQALKQLQIIAVDDEQSNLLLLKEIPLAGRIVAVADVFDALTHERPYKHAWTAEAAVSEILSQAGRQFDPGVVEAFSALDRAGLLGRAPVDDDPDGSPEALGPVHV